VTAGEALLVVVMAGVVAMLIARWYGGRGDRE